MLDTLLATPGATAAGMAAFVCLSIWPLFGSRSAILVVQLGASVAFATHYGLLGLMAPSAVNVLGSGQTVAALFAPNSPALNRIGYVLVGLMAATGIYFWTGPLSALPVTAMALIAIGRMQKNQIALRTLILAGGGIWIVYDYLAGSTIALGADVTSFAMGLAALGQSLSRDRLSELLARLGGGLRAARLVVDDVLDLVTAQVRFGAAPSRPAPVAGVARRDRLEGPWPGQRS